MRLWTVHPRFLDSRGLVALWREGLLAKAVLENQTKGYRHHPQLLRFREHPASVAAVCEYLHQVLDESRLRGYQFDAGKLLPPAGAVEPIEETRGQLEYEWAHLLRKLAIRAPDLHARYSGLAEPEAHGLFVIGPGPVREWESVL